MTLQLARFSKDFSLAALDAPERDQLAWIIADSIAAVVAGSAEPELAALARAVASGPGQSCLPGLGRCSGAEAAALVNGSAGTFLEMDEGNRFSRGHPAIHALPAALALAQERSLGLADFLAGTVVGYEIGSRIGAASRMRPATHPHGTWGTVGAAVACARTAGLSVEQTVQAINIGSSLCVASSMRTALEGGLVRNVYSGMSNRNGLLALTLTECGFSGEQRGIATIFGAVLSDQIDEAAIVAGLGTDWHLSKNYFKLHSCCRFNHGTLDALDRIAAQSGLPAPAQIASIEVTSYGLAAQLSDPAPHNTLAAKFSIPFATAARIVRGTSELSSFTWDAVRDPAIRELARKVSVREDAAMSARLPRERPARVVIRLNDGSVREAEVGVNRGDDDAPYTREELRGKFMNLCARVWDDRHCEALLESTLGLVDQTEGAGADRAWRHWCELLVKAPRA